MAKARRRRVRDTWKEKKWYVIKSPKMFGENEIGTTPSRDPDFLLKRRVEATMRNLDAMPKCRSTSLPLEDATAILMGYTLIMYPLYEFGNVFTEAFNGFHTLGVILNFTRGPAKHHVPVG